MNRRSGKFVFFIVFLLLVVILLQILSMIQSDRLYERLNVLLENLQRRRLGYSAEQKEDQPSEHEQEANELSLEKYPGDEGDWLVRCLSAEPATLEPIVEASTWATRWIVFDNIFETLIEYKPDEFELRGKLAEDFSISQDGLEIYFKLRDDIHFSDGTPVTTDDIIFTFETITDPNIDAASYANYFRDVDRYEKINDREIKFYMKRVYFLSLEYLGSMYIHPRHVYEYDDAREFNNRTSNPLGSGPYIFDKWDVGQKLVLVRNENYWGPKPKLLKRVFRFITNDTAALQALLAGQVDYMRPLPVQFAEKAKDEKFNKDFYCLSYWDAENTGYFWMGWNQARPFFADSRVRLAMTHLVDRKAIRDHILRNPEAEIPTGPFYIYGPQGDPNIEPWPYDPQKAKALLDEAGWIDHDGDGVRDKNGAAFRFKYMIVSGTQLHEKIAKLLKSSLESAGIELIIDPFEWSVFTQKVIDRDFDAVNMAWGGSVKSDPYQIWHSSQIESGSNYVRFNNPEADKLIEQARKTLDEDKRNALYHKFHRIIHRQQPYTFIYTRPEQRFLDRRFENVVIHKLGINKLEWYAALAKQKY